MEAMEAWLYAASWGSYMTAGDPGSCMYGFDERFTMQSEEHRANCLKWIDEQCLPRVQANPENYEEDELDQLEAFRKAVIAAPCAKEE